MDVCTRVDATYALLQLSVTYLDVCDKRTNRKRELALQYFFDCHCERCVEPPVHPATGRPGLDAAIAPEDVGERCADAELAAETQRLYDAALEKQSAQGVF